MFYDNCKDIVSPRELFRFNKRTVIFISRVNNLHDDKSYSIDMISKTYNLSQEDSKRWFESVKYSINGRISTEALKAEVTTLLKTGTIS